MVLKNGQNIWQIVVHEEKCYAKQMMQTCWNSGKLCGELVLFYLGYVSGTMNWGV